MTLEIHRDIFYAQSKRMFGNEEVLLLNKIGLIELDELLIKSPTIEYFYKDDQCSAVFNSAMVDFHSMTLLLSSENENLRTSVIRDIFLELTKDEENIHITLYFGSYFNERFMLQFNNQQTP